MNQCLKNSSVTGNERERIFSSIMVSTLNFLKGQRYQSGRNAYLSACLARSGADLGYKKFMQLSLRDVRTNVFVSVLT